MAYLENFTTARDWALSPPKRNPDDLSFDELVDDDEIDEDEDEDEEDEEEDEADLLDDDEEDDLDEEDLDEEDEDDLDDEEDLDEEDEERRRRRRGVAGLGFAHTAQAGHHFQTSRKCRRAAALRLPAINRTTSTAHHAKSIQSHGGVQFWRKPAVRETARTIRPLPTRRVPY